MPKHATKRISLVDVYDYYRKMDQQVPFNVQLCHTIGSDRSIYTENGGKTWNCPDPITGKVCKSGKSKGMLPEVPKELLGKKAGKKVKTVARPDHGWRSCGLCADVVLPFECARCLTCSDVYVCLTCIERFPDGKHGTSCVCSQCGKRLHVEIS